MFVGGLVKKIGFDCLIWIHGTEIMFGSRIDTQVLNNVCGDIATSPVLTGSVGSLQKACVCLADI